ncbi:DinB family protein [Aquiflexum gelatinilyticum]|uniref:DinB family protein n=1 Tax=Aquiflexum gelatinilyticum TaxID=2961943 RepID=A0A9X2T2K9_9BACT|nr:DinB family protein [Aquiflexum gelatinilyticum]MCR9017016.1 DinB family protein [Aquiflexum gelatinilyticum]MCS4434757.1 DinB family protein [Aquiflexum gelatinilyticum]
MTTQIKNWIDSIDNITKEAIEGFIALSVEKMHLKPNAETWSIAENFEHLITINRTYFPIFEKLKNGSFQGAFISRFPYFSNLFGNLILKSVSDGGKKKARTFPLWEPKVTEGDATVLERFQNHQEELKKWIIELVPFFEKKTVIHSPANKLIVYSLEKAIDIIVAHEQRHLDQAKKLL